MGFESRKWINQHLPELRKKYPNKTILVCEGKVIKAIDEPLDPIQINQIARKLCKGKDWSYTFVSEQEEEYILGKTFLDKLTENERKQILAYLA